MVHRVAVRRELKIMQLVTHPHVVRLYEIIETPSDIYVVMEYVESGDLFDFIVLHGRLHEDDARHFFQQVHLEPGLVASYILFSIYPVRSRSS
jgi:serine/threonine protein kinase